MDLYSIQCKHCGASIPSVPGATRLRCEFCGTEYLLQQAEQSSTPPASREIDYLGRGPLFRAQTPTGWAVRIFDDTDTFSHLAAVCKGLLLDSPEGAQMLFYPFAYFKSKGLLRSVGINLPMGRNYAIDGMTLTRQRELPPFQDYVRQRLMEICPNAADVQLHALDDLDGFLKRRSGVFLSEASSKLNRELTAEWGKFALRFTLGGAERYALLASIIVHAPQEAAQATQATPPPPETQQTAPSGKNAFKGFLDFGMSGGLLGAKNRGEGSSVPLQLPDLRKLRGIAGHDWGKCFDCVLLSPNGLNDRLNAEFNAFCQSVEYGTLYYALQDEEMRQVERIQIEGARQRQQNAFAASQRLRQTMNETSDIINRGYQQRSAVTDDIYRRASEGVRGVNTYENRYGERVQADVKYEHVYERSGSYAGTTEKGAETPWNWEELHKVH